MGFERRMVLQAMEENGSYSNLFFFLLICLGCLFFTLYLTLASGRSLLCKVKAGIIVIPLSKKNLTLASLF
jgi:hypothetical protein